MKLWFACATSVPPPSGSAFGSSPALMARASRRRHPQAGYRAPGGNGVILFVILFGLINAAAHILSLFGLLPVFR